MLAVEADGTGAFSSDAYTSANTLNFDRLLVGPTGSAQNLPEHDFIVLVEGDNPTVTHILPSSLEGFRPTSVRMSFSL